MLRTSVTSINDNQPNDGKAYVTLGYNIPAQSSQMAGCNRSNQFRMTAILLEGKLAQLSAIQVPAHTQQLA